MFSAHPGITFYLRSYQSNLHENVLRYMTTNINFEGKHFTLIHSQVATDSAKIVFVVCSHLVLMYEGRLFFITSKTKWFKINN